MKAPKIRGIIVIHPIPIGIVVIDIATNRLYKYPTTNIKIVAINNVFVSDIFM